MVESFVVCMVVWLLDGVMFEGFQIECECEFKGSDEQKFVVCYVCYLLDIDEVCVYLISGKMFICLVLSWQDCVVFMFIEGFVIKKISFLDLVFEGCFEVSGDEVFDVDLVLVIGELGWLILVLIEGLGGEYDFVVGFGVVLVLVLIILFVLVVVEEVFSELLFW